MVKLLKEKMGLKKVMITLLVLITLNFFIPRLMPGDPFTFLSAEEGSVSVTFSHEEIERYKAYYGLDLPLYQQFYNYGLRLLKGDMGYSIHYKDSVWAIILSRLPWTAALVGLSILLSAFLGIVFGGFSAYYQEKWQDRLLYFSFVLLSEIPGFLVGLIFLFVFAAYLGLFPLAGGIKPFLSEYPLSDKILSILHHGVLPVMTLSIARLGEFYLLSRNSMIGILSKDYITTAKAKGLRRGKILLRHALKNALLPIITRIFLSFGAVVSGAILVENVFRYPGIGSLMRQAVMMRDYPLIQGIFLFTACMVLSMNGLAEIIYKKLDPRVQ